MNEEIKGLKHVLERHAAALKRAGKIVKPTTHTMKCPQCHREIDLGECWNEDLQAVQCGYCAFLFRVDAQK